MATINTSNRAVTSAIYIALIAIWTALLLAVSVIPAYPLLGTGATITVSSILLSSLTAPLLGPVYGTVAGLIFGMAVPYVNPMTSIGLLTFLAPTLSALMAGLLLFNKWKEATIILVVQLIIWFANPFAFYQLMPIITWEFIPVFIFLLVPPVRKFIINTIVNVDKRYLPIALWCLAWTARIGGDVVTGNNIGVWVMGWGTPEMYPFWAPLTLYYAIADTLNCLAGALIGTGVLVALQKSGFHFTAVDHLREKVKKLSPKPVA
ncbi:MAG: hypothetical protein NWE92_04900 [Candidatus Bathyarchaeota archaeon]|nr:hypothetical protein [Candidatus Bathyarchaeota archaeon]